MRSSSWLLSLTLAGSAVAVQQNLNVFEKRQGQSKAPKLPDVPTYGFDVPVDHFDTTNNRTYSNRYFINDTYYKPGGPVIFFDAGEKGLDPALAAQYLAEYNGTVSAPMRLAANLSGLVIGWEHRYYGFSQPVEMDEKSGVPVNGSNGYKYLTIEQALEDIVFFATRFNTTKLDKNTVVKSTEKLDPYNVPWIYVGGSYAGTRAAWSRLRHPEIFYASWASSAPVQVQADGSPYWNPISRSLAANCTKDLQAVSAYVDENLSDEESSASQIIKAGAYMMQPRYTIMKDISPAFNQSATEVIEVMWRGMMDFAIQSLGAAQTTGIFCDFMQQFNVASYKAGRSKLAKATDTDERDIAYLALQNRGNGNFTQDGIAASNGEKGPEIATAAFTWAWYQYAKHRSRLIAASRKSENIIPTDYNRTEIDALSWNWQTLSQMGWFQYHKPGTQFFASKLVNETEFVAVVKSSFPDSIQQAEPPSGFPSSLNTTFSSTFNGWNMTPSNVMFTNGEFDPWRAFSLASEEDGSPRRNITSDIPKCNEAPADNGVFGLLYKGAVHVEDFSIPVTTRRASEEDPKPLYQGLDLFVRAWNVWAQCFNASRDDVRSGKGVDGKNSETPGSGTGTGTGSDRKQGAAERPSVAPTALLLVAVSLVFGCL